MAFDCRKKKFSDSEANSFYFLVSLSFKERRPVWNIPLEAPVTMITLSVVSSPFMIGFKCRVWDYEDSLDYTLPTLPKK